MEESAERHAMTAFSAHGTCMHFWFLANSGFPRTYEVQLARYDACVFF